MRKTHTKPAALALTLMLACPLAAEATEVGDSIDTFHNQTVTTTIDLQGRDMVTISNVTVTPSGHLIISSPHGEAVTGTLEVQLGGTLELNGGLQWFIRYDYDAAGNRICRRHSMDIPEND